MINSLRKIKLSNNELYNKLLEKNCKVLYNGRLLFEGKLKNFDNNTKYDKSLIVYEFDINDNVLLFTEEENNYIDQLNINDIKELNEDAKKFNKFMLLANNLPLFNLEIIDESIKSKIRKYGTNYRKIYENILLKNNEEE